MPTLWNDLARTFLRAVPLLLAFGALQIAANAVLPYALEGRVTWLLLPIINYFLYRIALFDLRAPYLARYAPRAEKVPPEAPIRFLLALVLPFLLATGVLFLLMVTIRPESENGGVVVTASGVGALWLALSIFGILLPAVAAGQPVSFDTALRVARKNWTGVALQLYLLGALGGAAFLWAEFMGREWLDDLQAAPPLHYMIDTLLAAVGFASQVPTVVILTRAYRQYWPQAAGVAAQRE